MELNANKFSVIVTSIRKRPYDFLDQRKMEFDQDYDDFKRQIGELHVSSNIISFRIIVLIKWYTLWIIEGCKNESQHAIA